MSLVNAAIAVAAAETELRPFVLSLEDLDYCPPFPIPNLGSFLPDDWERTDTRWIVDCTGHGYESAPALTVEQFKRRLRAYLMENPSHGFGIVKEDEFQVVVAAFRQIG